jgi:hypothetical protein
MATSFTLQNDPALPQGYLKVDGSTSATFTTSGITGSSLTDSSVTASKLGTNEQKQICKAWVNFNGTTSPGTIRSSYNVSSVTKNATGNYTVNFTNTLSDANYSATATTQAGAVAHFAVGASKATGSYTLVTGYVSSFTAGFLGFDVADISVQVFGN